MNGEVAQIRGKHDHDNEIALIQRKRDQLVGRVQGSNGIRRSSMKPRVAIIGIVTALGVSGCANMTTTEQRTLSGAAMGALGGAAIAAVAEGSLAAGAAIGAGVGAGAGYLYSLSRSEHHAAYQPTKHYHHTARRTKPSRPESPVRTSDERLAAN